MEPREIKFRAWDKNLKRFAYIELLIGCVTLPEMIVADFEFWQQYTGLKDRNGAEIYEGDVVRHRYDHGGIGSSVYSVEFGYCAGGGSDESFSAIGFYLTDYYNGEPSSQWSIVGQESTLEVVGNIYKNPELVDES